MHIVITGAMSMTVQDTGTLISVAHATVVMDETDLVVLDACVLQGVPTAPPGVSSVQFIHDALRQGVTLTNFLIRLPPFERAVDDPPLPPQKDEL